MTTTQSPKKTLVPTRDAADWIAGLLFRLENGRGSCLAITLSVRDVPMLAHVHQHLIQKEAAEVRAAMRGPRH